MKYELTECSAPAGQGILKGFRYFRQLPDEGGRYCRHCRSGSIHGFLSLLRFRIDQRGDTAFFSGFFSPGQHPYLILPAVAAFQAQQSVLFLFCGEWKVSPVQMCCAYGQGFACSGHQNSSTKSRFRKRGIKPQCRGAARISRALPVFAHGAVLLPNPHQIQVFHGHRTIA